ncbi:MAG: prepilin-type N-terminal cleavage/methylation domain-containing protein [Phycisphaeraceae bacterium]|nr:prepilin-type N-terminal cleavage/methylation domain-containing protein [Phycisphaeraceae bacterium]
MRRRRAPSRAFTLVEMLVVISVIAVALVAIIPAFGRIIESASYASSVNRVTSTLSLARSIAMESGRQTGVVFLYDIETERTTLLLVQRSDDQGVIPPADRSFGDIPASVFVPADAGPVLLPRGLGVYGLALTAADANPAAFDAMGRWYPNEALRDNTDGSLERFWIFPRNDARVFINNNARLESFAGDYASYPGSYAVTFFVRFSSSGAIVTASSNSATDPVNSFLEFPDLPRNPNAFPGDPGYLPLDQARVFDPHVIYDSGGVVELNPEVRLRSVDLVAVVDLARLAEGSRVASPWFVRPAPSRLQPGDEPGTLSPIDPKARFLDADIDDFQLLSSGDGSPTRRTFASSTRRISRWIDDNAEVIGFNRHTGAVLRRVAQ